MHLIMKRHLRNCGTVAFTFASDIVGVEIGQIIHQLTGGFEFNSGEFLGK
jgi:hypothetical protein